MTPAERKAARASWEVKVFRGGWEEMADDDALFWDRIPVDERAEAVWNVSRELHEIAHPDERAAARPQDLADVAALERLARKKPPR